MLHHTMLVTAPAASQPGYTQPEVPVEYPIHLQQPSPEDPASFLQACFYADEILAQIFPDRHDAGHGRETNEVFGRVRSTENGLVLRSDGESALITPRKTPPVRDITRGNRPRSSPAAKTSSRSPTQRRREQANEREKQRIAVMKNAMNVLKNSIPAARKKTKITKLEILKLALEYIGSLKAQLVNDEEPATEDT